MYQFEHENEYSRVFEAMNRDEIKASDVDKFIYDHELVEFFSDTADQDVHIEY